MENDIWYNRVVPSTHPQKHRMVQEIPYLELSGKWLTPGLKCTLSKCKLAELRLFMV
jgi:hypothetical protein